MAAHVQLSGCVSAYGATARTGATEKCQILKISFDGVISQIFFKKVKIRQKF
jgi:hypothetical protein